MKKIIFSLAVLVLAAMFGAMNVEAAPVAVTGWAWSSTIGWVQFATGVSSPVTIDDSTGNWAGYAWSDNIGWISFNSNSCGAQAHLDKTNGVVVGWAKALSADGNGWDGCIELAGTNHASSAVGGGVFWDDATNNFSGYAWGSDVVGWLLFNTGVPNPVNVDITGSTPSGFSGNCGPSTQTTISAPGNVTFTASINPPGGTGPYEYNWDGTWVSSNTKNVSYATPGIYSGPVLSIRDSLGTLGTVSPNCGGVTFLNPVGAVSLKIGNTAATATFDSLKIKQGKPFAISWNVNIPDDTDYACAPVVSAMGDASWSSWTGLASGAFIGSGNGTSGNTGVSLLTNSGTPVGTYIFAVTCADGTHPANPTYSGNTRLNVIQSTINEL